MEIFRQLFFCLKIVNQNPNSKDVESEKIIEIMI